MMALLTPNSTFTLNGVLVKEKIIPDGTRWKDATKAKKADFSANSLYKKEVKLNNNTGKAAFFTVHNTDDLDRVEDDGEQYVRATYNENMGSVRVHFYVDDLCAWMSMKSGTGMCKNDPEGSAEVTWHAGDGSTKDGGNMLSLSMEVIMNDTPEHNAKAMDNGARIIAWMMVKHQLPLSKLVSHTYWVNKSAGKTFDDVDKQCTNPIYNKKWCPTYIFKSSNPDTAYKNWKAFKETVKKYMDTTVIGGSQTVVTPPTDQPKTLYRVQTGAFTKKVNAEALAKEIKSKGFDTYIVLVDNLYKVQVGAFSVKANAITLGKKLKEAGYQTFVTTKSGQSVSATPEKKMEKGSKVKVKKGAKTYTGGNVASWVYDNTYTIDELSGSRAVLDRNGICTAFNVADLILQ